MTIIQSDTAHKDTVLLLLTSSNVFLRWEAPYLQCAYAVIAMCRSQILESTNAYARKAQELHRNEFCLSFLRVVYSMCGD